jgi:anoctamin-1
VIPESSIESQELPNESSQNNCECPKPDNLSCPVPTIYFTDGMRSVDFILVWDAFTEDAVKPEAQEKRKIFEANLAKEGLELEYVPQESNGLNFVKVSFTYGVLFLIFTTKFQIHAPQEVLRRYGEILKLRMPMREVDISIIYIF